MDSIWVEKYRPKDFSELRGQEEVVSRIKAFLESKNMPHLLFAGPPGTGKTSLALLIAKKLFGSTWNENFLELNASDDRGIDVVRSRIKDFARTKAIGDVPFKIIYLDECDSLTDEAQHALRRTMESFTATCRFILSANYSSKIIEPIQSRCAIFRFKALEKSVIFEIIDSIARQEGISVDERAKEALFEVCAGDCRRLENIMQSCATIGKGISAEQVYSIASMAQPREIKEVLLRALSGNFLDARKLLLDLMLKQGLSGLDVIRQIQKEVLSMPVDSKERLKIIDKCGEIEFRIVEGADEFIQLEALLAWISSISLEK